jgi:hypothetical protein
MREKYIEQQPSLKLTHSGTAVTSKTLRLIADLWQVRP